jgi:hypothetical protein
MMNVLAYFDGDNIGSWIWPLAGLIVCGGILLMLAKLFEWPPKVIYIVLLVFALLIAMGFFFGWPGHPVYVR